jgi:hypothetical protein
MILKKFVVYLLLVVIPFSLSANINAATIKQIVSPYGTVTYYVSNDEEKILAFNSMFSKMETRAKIIYTNGYIGDKNTLNDYVNYRYTFQDTILRTAYGIGSFSGTGISQDNNVFSYEFSYNETPEQTQYVYEKIHKAIKYNIHKLKTDYEKVVFAYNWVLNNTKTDYSMNNISAYSGIAGDGTACQGYSTIFATIAKELGLECDIIFGGVNGSSSNHAWNIVELDGKWYCIDTTWGNSENRSKYFLITKETLKSKEYGEHISDMYKKYEDAGEIFATENYEDTEHSSTSYVLPSVYNIKMDIFKTYILDINEGYTFMVSNPDNIPVSFMSSNPDIAMINDEGVVIGLKEGTTVITAYNDDLKFSQNCTINITNKIINTSLSSVNIKLKKDDSEKINVKNALKYSNIKWTSSNNQIAKVSKNGSVTGISSGKCVISCTVTNGTSIIVLKCKVTVTK